MTNLLTDSILNSIKKLLGLEPEYTHFDDDIMIHINSTLSTLNQIGVGPTEGFRIDSSDQKWENFIGSDLDFESVKTYIYLKVRLIFDPPTSSFVLDALDRTAKEIEWRLNVNAEGRAVNGE